MYMTTRQRKEMIKFMKKNGVSYLKDGEVEIDLRTESIRAQGEAEKKKVDKTDPALLRNDMDSATPSDSDMLFYSTSAYDLITQTRKDDTPRN